MGPCTPPLTKNAHLWFCFLSLSTTSPTAYGKPCSAWPKRSCFPLGIKGLNLSLIIFMIQKCPRFCLVNICPGLALSIIM